MTQKLFFIFETWCDILSHICLKKMPIFWIFIQNFLKFWNFICRFVAENYGRSAENPPKIFFCSIFSPKKCWLQKSGVLIRNFILNLYTPPPPPPPLLFFFFSFFKKKLNFQFFCLSDRFLSSSRKLVSATVFSPKFFSPAAGWLKRPYFCRKFFSPAAGWLIYELHLGILFSLKKLSQRHYLVVSFRQLFEWKKNSQM